MFKVETVNKLNRSLTQNEEGQAFTEYIMLLAIITGLYLAVTGAFIKFKIEDKMTNPLKTQFAAAYRFGHPKAKGFDDGGTPENHPRYVGTLRIFFNPQVK